MKNNKILMSLVLASISAMAAAPFVIDTNDNNDTESKKLVNIDQIGSDHNQEVQAMNDSDKEDFTKQMEAMLMKKSSVQHLSESISVLASSYGKDSESMQQQIFKELNLAAVGDGNSRDSTQITGVNPGPRTTNVQNAVFCHNACHGACHAACHGSRGWR